MSTACIEAKKSAREVKHLRIGALEVSKARLLKVLYGSEKKLTIDEIVTAISDGFDKRYPVEKIKLLCADVEMMSLMTKDMESSSVTYGLNKAGQKLVTCALGSFAMDPVTYKNYEKFVRKSESPNVPHSDPKPNIDPTALRARSIEAQMDCV